MNHNSEDGATMTYKPRANPDNSIQAYSWCDYPGHLC